MRECYRTPAGKQERQAQVEPLRREVRDTFVGKASSGGGSGSNGANGAAASSSSSSSNGTGQHAAYTDTDISIALKVRKVMLRTVRRVPECAPASAYAIVHRPNHSGHAYGHVRIF